MDQDPKEPIEPEDPHPPTEAEWTDLGRPFDTDIDPGDHDDPDPFGDDHQR